MRDSSSTTDGTRAPRDWEPVMFPGMEDVIPPRELWFQDMPLALYFKWLWEYRVFLTLLCGLREDDAVLEVGCGHGRTMLALVDYLRTPGRYEGFDINLPPVQHAHRTISSPQCAVNFSHLDVYHEFYNPAGREDVTTVRFPYPDAEFDVAYGASVFTHMMPAGIARYLVEVGRVLRPGGRALFSVYLLDFFRGPGTARSRGHDFVHAVPGHDRVVTRNPDFPEELVAYPKAKLEELVRAAGLSITRIVPGTWSRSHPVGVCEQDLLVLARE